MEKETLRQYLTYNRDINEVSNICYNLDRQLKYLHSQHYYVSKLNSDNILCENNASSSGYTTFTFSSIAKCHDVNQNIHDNIVDLAKLAIGIYISLENGFCDYTALDISQIRGSFDDIKTFIPNSDYYEKVIVDDDTSMYYSDYLHRLSSSSKTNAIQKVKATNQGKIYGYDDIEDAAFIRIIFYPVMIVSFITVAILLYVIFQ